MARTNKKNQKSKSPKNAPKRDANGQFAKKSVASDTPKSKASEAKSYGPGEGKKDDGSDVIGILRITRTEESATGSTSKTTTYNIKSDGTREAVSSCEEGEKIGDNSTRPQMENSIRPDLETIASQNPARIEVGGHPYYSNKYVADVQASIRNTTPSDFEVLARLQKVNELIEQGKRLRRKEMAKKLARGAAQIIMWALSIGIFACASVGIYTLGTQVFR